MTDKKIIPIQPLVQPLAEAESGGCTSEEPFALMVLGTMMEPEFVEGDIIVCEPEGVAQDGSFVVAKLDGEFYFRQLQILDGRWFIKALNPLHATLPVSPEDVIAVVILKKKPGRRKEQTHYV